MRQTTAINQAYMRYARTYEQWHKDCQHIPIKVGAPRILYLPGVGFEINGDIRKETAEDIIAGLNRATRDCIRLINEKCKPIAPSVFNNLDGLDWLAEDQPEEEALAEQT